MRMIDRIFGRKVELESEPVPVGVPIADARAVDRYQRMLRTAPPEVIERAHVEAFERLTPAQLDLLFERLTKDAEQADERPADALPASLARSVERAERRRPGAIARSVEAVEPGVGASAWLGASILDAVVWYLIASVAWSVWSAPEEQAGDPSAAAADPPDPTDAGDFWDWGF
ncbi:hypothetical protein [Agromyces albus]|uniref:hypothetical protein n=1 Tax=Agromyces albus TaxID=205332 RepID=UPI00277D25B9|nr:hypothetical protein [Agromyces albus]MDQ0577163.1 hypothetical protein [Agromyces albus]